MPTYEYHCDACEHHFDEFQSITEPALKKCPKCRKAKLRRIFGIGAAVLFKGSGFYITDYRSKAYQEAAKKEAPSSEKATGKDAKTSKTSPSTTSTKPKKESAS